MRSVKFPLEFTDPDGNVYRLKRSVWSHIVAGSNPHGELVESVEEIRKCVEDPDEISQSKQSETRYVYRRVPETLDYR